MSNDPHSFSGIFFSSTYFFLWLTEFFFTIVYTNEHSKNVYKKDNNNDAQTKKSQRNTVTTQKSYTRGLHGSTKIGPTRPEKNFKIIQPNPVRHTKLQKYPDPTRHDPTQPDPTQSKSIWADPTRKKNNKLFRQWSEFDPKRNNFTSGQTDFDPTRERVLWAELIIN